jgi:CheY-like chemotaxis protein
MGLRSEGYEVLSAPSGAEAVRVLAESEVGVVLTDLNMPGMGGLTLCTRIAEGFPDLPDPRQLRHPLQPAFPVRPRKSRATSLPALLASVLSGRKPD